MSGNRSNEEHNSRQGAEFSFDQLQDRTRRYQANPDYLLREIAGDCILVPIGEAAELDNCVLALNDSCQFLWNQFQTPRTIDEVVAAALEEYSDPTGAIEHEIYEFVEAYLQVGLLQEEQEL